MSDPTYRDVAEWLPTDVREAIEAGTPCPVSGGVHQWECSRAEIHQWGCVQAVAVFAVWRCDCGISRTTEPEERQ